MATIVLNLIMGPLFGAFLIVINIIAITNEMCTGCTASTTANYHYPMLAIGAIVPVSCVIFIIYLQCVIGDVHHRARVHVREKI